MKAPESDTRSDIISILNNFADVAPGNLTHAKDIFEVAIRTAGDDTMLREYVVENCMIPLALLAEQDAHLVKKFITTYLQNYILEEGDDRMKKAYIAATLKNFSELHESLKDSVADMGEHIIKNLVLYSGTHTTLETEFMRQSMMQIFNVVKSDSDAAILMIKLAATLATKNNQMPEFTGRMLNHLPAIVGISPRTAEVMCQLLIENNQKPEDLTKILKNVTAAFPTLARTEAVRPVRIIQTAIDFMESNRVSNSNKQELIERGLAILPAVAKVRGSTVVHIVRALRKLAGEDPDRAGIYEEFTVTNPSPKNFSQTVILPKQRGQKTLRIVTPTFTGLTRKFNSQTKKCKFSHAEFVHRLEIQNYVEMYAESAMQKDAAPSLKKVFLNNMVYDRKLPDAKPLVYPYLPPKIKFLDI